MATEDTGFTIVPKGRIRSKKKPRGRGEVLGEYQEMITAIQSVGGDPLPVHGTTKASLPTAGKKADRLYCVNDGNAKGVFLDTGASIVQVAGNDIKSGTTVPGTERADMLFVKTDDPSIYHDNGATLTKIANVSVTSIRQNRIDSTGSTTFTNAIWTTKTTITLVTGEWHLHFYFEARPAANAWFQWRLRNDTAGTNLLGGDDIRQPGVNLYYMGLSGFAYVSLGVSTQFSLDFRGSSTANSYARKAYIWAMEYKATT